MPIKRGRQGDKCYYQFGESGKKYFYIAGNKRSRLIAKNRAEKQQAASHVKQSGGKVKKEIIPIWGGDSPVAKKLPIWGLPSYYQLHGGAQWNFNIPSGKPKIFGGAQFRFNTQTPERMAEIQAKYKGQAHPDFIDQYADILNQPPKMMGWRNGVSRSEWYPEEKAAYLRDGSPISKREVIRIAGNNWNNMDELTKLRGLGAKPVVKWPLKPKNANVFKGHLGNQHG